MVADFTLEPLVEVARGEALLHGVGLTDPRSLTGTIWADFTRAVAPWADVAYEQDVNPRRVMERLEAGEPLDFVLVGNPARFDTAGLIQPFDQPYRELYPPGWTDGDRRWAPVYVQPTVVVYNWLHIAVPPAKWSDLADAARDDGLVFDPPWRMVVAGPTLAELSSVFSNDWQSFIREVADQHPLLVADNERVVLEVATGRRRVGLAPWNIARRVRPNSPVRYTFLAPTPCIPGFAALVARAKHEHLARLFVTWLTSPAGQASYARTGRIPAYPKAEAPTALTNVLPHGIDPIYGTADWLAHPEPFTDSFRELFPAPPDELAEGKLR